MLFDSSSFHPCATCFVMDGVWSRYVQIRASSRGARASLNRKRSICRGEGWPWGAGYPCMVQKMHDEAASPKTGRGRGYAGGHTKKPYGQTGGGTEVSTPKSGVPCLGVTWWSAILEPSRGCAHRRPGMPAVKLAWSEQYFYLLFCQVWRCVNASDVCYQVLVWQECFISWSFEFYPAW